jgi:TetR/AcrR family transcriptional repressor of nem operon
MVIISAPAMRYPAQHKQETRERIVRAAARRFQRQGPERTAISDLMRDLRLTHGGFYRHFDSKEELFEEAIEHGLRRVSDRLAAAAEQAPPGGELKALIDTYLSPEHCGDTANGCPVAALAAEVARTPAGSRRVFQRAVRAYLRRMARYFPGATARERERRALLLFTGMAGTLMMARAVTDQGDRRRILADGRAFYLNAVGG